MEKKETNKYDQRAPGDFFDSGCHHHDDRFFPADVHGDSHVEYRGQVSDRLFPYCHSVPSFEQKI